MYDARVHCVISQGTQVPINAHSVTPPILPFTRSLVLWLVYKKWSTAKCRVSDRLSPWPHLHLPAIPMHPHLLQLHPSQLNHANHHTILWLLVLVTLTTSTRLITKWYQWPRRSCLQHLIHTMPLALIPTRWFQLSFHSRRWYHLSIYFLLHL